MKGEKPPRRRVEIHKIKNTRPGTNHPGDPRLQLSHFDLTTSGILQKSRENCGGVRLLSSSKQPHPYQTARDQVHRGWLTSIDLSTQCYRRVHACNPRDEEGRQKSVCREPVDPSGSHDRRWQLIRPNDSLRGDHRPVRKPANRLLMTCKASNPTESHEAES